jgi:predicted permease
MRIWSRIANVFRSRRLDDDIDEELRAHFEEAGGARAGSHLRAREAVHDAVVAGWLESILADLAFGWRQLLKHKTASGAAILSLGLGIGSCTAAFRMIDALLLRPLPVKSANTLQVLGYEYTNEVGQRDVGFSCDYPAFRLMRAAVKGEAELIAIDGVGRINITFGSDEEMERISRQYVSGWMFQKFGLNPAAGRLLTEQDDLHPGAHPVVVLSHDYWSRRFGRDPKAIGRTFRSGNDLFQIIGVAPEGFTGTETGTVTDIFVPTMMNAEAINESHWNWFRTWVVPNRGASLELVQQHLRATLAAHRREQIKDAPPGTPKRMIEELLSSPVVLEPASAGFSGMQQTYRRSMVILGVVVGLVLLIACFNVANLMTAQAAARDREMALRVSIGAGRARLVQLVLIESSMIASLASALGCVFAWWAAPFVVGLINPPDDPVRLIMPADWRVTAFAVALVFVVAILFGLAPALRASSVQPAGVLKGANNTVSRRRMMGALVAAQVAFCVVVLFNTRLFVATFQNMVKQPMGFSAERLLTAATVTKRDDSPQKWYQVAEHLRSLPGVESASLAMWPLMSGSGWNGGVWANGHTPQNERPVWLLGVAPQWLETMKIPLLDGRDFRADDAFPSVAVVNESFARIYFDRQHVIGRNFELAYNTKRLSMRVIGVAADARYTGMRGPIPATAYVPFQAMKPEGDLRLEHFATYLVRTRAANPLSMATEIRVEVARAVPGFRVANVGTEEELVRRQTLRERLLATLSLFFAAVALALAGIGLYGVLNYGVLERRRELGIRIALGARGVEIAAQVLVGVLLMIAAGCLAGIGMGVGLERYVEKLLYQVKSTEVGVIVTPVVTMVLAGVLAAVPPVSRALRIDPAKLLRAE